MIESLETRNKLYDLIASLHNSLSIQSIDGLKKTAVFHKTAFYRHRENSLQNTEIVTYSVMFIVENVEKRMYMYEPQY